MRSKTVKLLISFLSACTCLLTSFCFGQSNFTNKRLNILEAVAMSTNYQNIIPAMETSKLTYKGKVTVAKGNELLTFDMGEQPAIKLLYSASKKLIYATMSFPFLDLEPVEMAKELKEKGFENSWKLETVLGRRVVEGYTKQAYPYQFTLSNANPIRYDIYIFNLEFKKLDDFVDFNNDSK